MNILVFIFIIINIYFKTFCLLFIDEDAAKLVNKKWIDAVKNEYSYKDNDNNFYLVIVNEKDLVYQKNAIQQMRYGAYLINKKLKDLNKAYDDNKFLAISNNYLETLTDDEKNNCNLVRILEESDDDKQKKIKEKSYNDIFYKKTESANININNNTGAIITITTNTNKDIYLFCSNICYTKTNLEGMFEGVEDIKNITIKICYSNNYKTPCMFENCKNLEYFYLNKMSPVKDNINATHCYHMFENCENLKNVNLEKINFISECNSIFRNCKALEEIKFTRESKLEECFCLFENCENLKKVNFNKEEITFYNRSQEVFKGCKHLKELIGIKKITFKDKHGYGRLFSWFFNDCKELSLDNIELVFDIDKDIDLTNMFNNNKTSVLNINFENENFLNDDINFENNYFHLLLNGSNIKTIKYKDQLLENPKDNDKLFYFFKNPKLYNKNREKYQNTNTKEELSAIKDSEEHTPDEHIPEPTPSYTPINNTEIPENLEHLGCCSKFIKCCCCCKSKT